MDLIIVLKLQNKKTHTELEESSIKPNMIFDYEYNKIYIDHRSEFFLIRNKVDYIKEDYKNIFESKFVFIQDKDFATSCGGISLIPDN